MQTSLNAALQLHQQGHVEQAQRIYRQVLAEQPDHPEPWHLLGVAALQRGAVGEGVELIRRAIALQPHVPAYHLHLAEGYLCRGDFEQAVGSGRAALRLQPDSPDALYLLGRVYAAEGRTEEAAESFRDAVRLRPDFALAHNNLANALRELDDGEGAVRHFRRACELMPGRGELHSNLGQFLLEQGETEDALHHCREAVRLLPAMAEAHCNLGNVLRERGQLAEARVCYAEALRLNPDLAMVHNNLGQTAQEEGRLDEAVAWYEEALRREPACARFHTNLADVLRELEKYEEAQLHFERALRHDPRHFQAHTGLGMLLQETGHYAEAQRHFREALRLKPELAASHCSLGTIAEEMGDSAMAETCFREALRLQPASPPAYAQLATLLRTRLPDADREAMQRLLDDPKVKPLGRANLLHGLAHVHDATGDHARAAECLHRAKAIQREEWARRNRLYSAAEHTQFVDQVLASYTSEFFRRVQGFGIDSERPVFIFGLPRSGTTLVEQVLAAHSQVFGAGELKLTHESFRALPAVMGLDAPPLACVGRMEAVHVCQLAQRHLARLQGFDRSAPRITDKMPDNYLHLGLLATLFPRARFIHCRRDLRDVAVSCWSINFGSIRWNADVDSIAARFHDYRRLMDHWRAVLSVPVLEVRYEEMVDDLETGARRLVEWCGLPWEPPCLDFHEVRRPVRTASVNQVRRPLYRTSVGRWKNYEQTLGALFDALPRGE